MANDVDIGGIQEKAETAAAGVGDDIRAAGKIPADAVAREIHICQRDQPSLVMADHIGDTHIADAVGEAEGQDHRCGQFVGVAGNRHAS